MGVAAGACRDPSPSGIMTVRLDSGRVTMKRTLDVLVPVGYVVILLIAIFIGNETALGAVAVFGAIFVGLYYAVLRRGGRTD